MVMDIPMWVTSENRPGTGPLIPTIMVLPIIPSTSELQEMYQLLATGMVMGILMLEYSGHRLGTGI